MSTILKVRVFDTKWVVVNGIAAGSMLAGWGLDAPFARGLVTGATIVTLLTNALALRYGIKVPLTPGRRVMDVAYDVLFTGSLVALGGYAVAALYALAMTIQHTAIYQTVGRS